MSTSEPGGTLPKAADFAPAFATAGVDVELIAELANDFFRAPPGAVHGTPAVPTAGRPGGVGTTARGDALPAPPPIDVPTVLLSESDLQPNHGGLAVPDAVDADPLRALFASGDHRVPVARASALSTAAPATEPDAFSRAAGSYYFLEHARPPAGAPSAPLARAAAVSPRFGPAAPPLDVDALRRDFPILRETVHGRPLIWLDNAATTQKPRAVIERISQFYEHENSNVHRAAHELAARSTDAYEEARRRVARFLNADSDKEIVHVRGATEAINLVAQSWGRANVGRDDEIIVSWLEHHANIVPWQMLCAEKGAHLRVIPVDDDGQLLLGEYAKLLGPRTKLVALSQVSNALGTITPVHEVTALAHRHGARVLVDGAQAVSHMRVDVQAIDCDWYVFSGHKLFGPTGIGVLYGKTEVLDAMPPWQGGGNMIEDVTFEKTRYHPPPVRFEAGTGNIADAVGLGAAIAYLERIGIDNVNRYEHGLLAYGTEALRAVPGLRLIGTAPDKASVLSFVLAGFDTVEVGKALDREGIAVRAGHHCAQPILRRFGLEATVRPSLAFYNTCAEMDALASALRRLRNGRALRG